MIMRVSVVSFRTYSDVRNASPDAHTTNTHVFATPEGAREWLCSALVEWTEHRAGNTWIRVERRFHEDYFERTADRTYVLRDEVRHNLEKMIELSEAWRRGEFVRRRWEWTLTHDVEVEK